MMSQTGPSCIEFLKKNDFRFVGQGGTDIFAFKFIGIILSSFSVKEVKPYLEFELVFVTQACHQDGSARDKD